MGWKRADHVAYVGDDERVVVLKLDARGSTPLALQGSGAAIWHALGPAPRSLDDIVADLASSYGVEAPSIESEVGTFLLHLLDAGLVVGLSPEHV